MNAFGRACCLLGSIALLALVALAGCSDSDAAPDPRKTCDHIVEVCEENIHVECSEWTQADRAGDNRDAVDSQNRCFMAAKTCDDVMYCALPDEPRATSRF